MVHTTVYRSGDYIELTKDINCIPAGVYRVADHSNCFYFFSVSSRVFFGVSEDGARYFRRIAKHRGKIKKAGENLFLERYYKLLNDMSATTSFDPREPFTFCALEPSVARECHIEQL